MRKRLPYLALAVLLSFSTCFLMGGRVRAASPIFYEGNVQFNVGRRDTLAPVDFNYSSFETSIPYYGTIPRVYPELGGIPSNKSDSEYTYLPSFISVQSPDLIKNGGYLYVSFVVAYGAGNSFSPSQITLNYNNVEAKLYQGGSVEFANQYGTSLTLQKTQHSKNITTFEVKEAGNPYPYYMGIGGFNYYDGSNFPKIVYFTESTQWGLDNHIAYVYGYGDTSQTWYKSNFFNLKITVPAYQGQLVAQDNCIYILLDSLVTGTFKSTVKQISLVNTATGDSSNAGVYCSDLIYLCPVYCYATSTSNYEDIEVYLQSINNNLISILGGQSAPQSVLESYAAMGSEAREAAEEAVRAMSVAQPTFNESDYDVFSNIDSVAMQQFSGVLSFLSLRRILPILLAALALVTIGYLFFGKK